MGYDAIVDGARLDGALTATAEAIRSKTDSTEPITFDMDNGFKAAVESIENGGGVVDNSVIDSILDATIKSYENNTVTKIYDGRFKYCSQLKWAKFGKAEALNPQVFMYCGALKFVDFASLTNIYTQVFTNCTKLQALIIRTASVCSLTHTNAIASSLIGTGEGYIYVPNSLMSEYQQATNWSTYSDKFRAIEDYTLDGTTTGELDLAKMGVTL